MPPLRKPIRWKLRGNLYSIAYAEDPERWHATRQESVRDAVAWARAMKGEILAPKPILFEALAEHFYDDSGAWVQLQAKAKRRLSAQYLPQMRHRLRCYLLPAFGKRPVRDIGFREFQAWILDLRGVKGQPIKNSTKNKVIDCAKIMFREWARDKIIPESPIATLTALPDTDETPRDVFTVEEVEKLFPRERAELEAIWADQGKHGREFAQLWLSYFIAARDTGVRPSEQIALTWGDYDVEFGGFPIRKAVENTTGALKLYTKTGSVKPALLTERGIQELMLWGAVSAHVLPGDYIWSFDGRTPVRTESALKHFKGVCKRAGIERRNRTPYCLRHTFATRALESGRLTLAEIQMLMGHSANGKTVLDSYFHPTAKSIMRMAQGMGERMEGMAGRS